MQDTNRKLAAELTAARIALGDRENELGAARGRVEELEERQRELEGLVKNLEDDLVTVRGLVSGSDEVCFPIGLTVFAKVVPAAVIKSPRIRDGALYQDDSLRPFSSSSCLANSCLKKLDDDFETLGAKGNRV